MMENAGPEGFTDAEWAVWEPLIEAVRPRGKTPPKELRRRVAAIFWRHRNGATWRAIPAELGPWWLAAQLFIRWAELGAWDRLLERAQDCAGGLELGLTFLDGTNIRAHAKAAGAPKKGELQRAETSVKRLVALAAASAPRP
jgi:transposase